MNDGSRGAKGSINDRLISLMYRERYKKDKLKKSYYNVRGKSVQVTYINNLKSFKVAPNTSNLDAKDKDTLSNVKIVLAPNKKIYTGIDFYDKNVKINDNEPVTFSGKLTEEQVDLDKEETKVEKEYKIMDEVVKEVEKTIRKAVSIKEEMKDLSSKIAATNDLEEIDSLKKKYDKLMSELNELKNKYYIMREKYDFDDYQMIENYTLNKSIDDYKSMSNINELEMLVEFCKEESKQMEEYVIDEEIDKKTRENDIKKGVVSKDYKALENIKEHMDYSDVERQLFELSVEQAKIIAEIDEKMSRIERQTDISIDIGGIARLFDSMLRIATGIISLPIASLAPNRLGTSLIRNGVNRLNETTFYREREEYKYFDASNDIIDGKNKLERAEDMLNTAMDEVLVTENNFKKRFEKYASYNSDYKKVLDKIDGVKGIISKKSKEFEEYRLQLEKQNTKNQQKVKILSIDRHNGTKISA